MFRYVASTIKVLQEINNGKLIFHFKFWITQYSIFIQFSPKVEILQALEIFFPRYIYHDGVFC